MTQSEMDEPKAVSLALALYNEQLDARSEECASKLEKLCQKLRSYPDLGENWDGEGSKTPSQRAVNDALTFLENRPNGIPLPHPEVGSEGEVGVYWDIRRTDVFAEVVFEGDGTYYYLVAHGKAGSEVEEYMDEGVDVDEPWPDEILCILREQSGS